jgi:hypothetical protein
VLYKTHQVCEKMVGFARLNPPYPLTAQKSPRRRRGLLQLGKNACRQRSELPVVIWTGVPAAVATFFRGVGAFN